MTGRLPLCTGLVRRPRLPAPLVPGGFGFPLGFLAAILATTVTVAAGATTHPWVALIALAGVIAAIAGISTAGATVCTAMVGWTLYSGFVLGRHGDLAFTPRAMADAVILGAVAPLAALVAAVVRTAQARTRTATGAIPAPRSAPAPSSVAPSTRA